MWDPVVQPPNHNRTSSVLSLVGTAPAQETANTRGEGECYRGEWAKAWQIWEGRDKEVKG